jgi:hypothetical protein
MKFGPGDKSAGQVGRLVRREPGEWWDGNGRRQWWTRRTRRNRGRHSSAPPTVRARDTVALRSRGTDTTGDLSGTGFMLGHHQRWCPKNPAGQRTWCTSGGAAEATSTQRSTAGASPSRCMAMGRVTDMSTKPTFRTEETYETPLTAPRIGAAPARGEGGGRGVQLRGVELNRLVGSGGVETDVSHCRPVIASSSPAPGPRVSAFVVERIARDPFGCI